MKRRVFLKGISATAGALAFPAIAIGQQYKAEYKMSTVVPPAFAWGKGGEIFANLVRERTAGRINIKQYPGSSLVQGDQTREFSAMRQGVIDVLCGAPINCTARCASSPYSRCRSSRRTTRRWMRCSRTSR